MKVIIGLIEHFGDIVACEPVSRYVRNKFPDAELSWAVLAPFRELIDTNPHIDQTVIVECLTDWIKLIKHQDYDEIVDLHVNYRICQCCGIPLIKEHGNPFVNVFEWFDHGALLEAFSLGAGLPKLSAAPKVYIGPEHVAAVDALGLPDEYCVIHRESNDKNKDWNTADWRALAKWIKEELHIPVIEIGATKDTRPSPLADITMNLINRTPLLQTAEIIRRARFFIGIDSGPAHFANAVQTPGVVLLGRYGSFRKYMPFTGYYADDNPDVKLVRNLLGPVREIPVLEVIDATQYVVQATTERKRDNGAEPKTIRTVSVATVDAQDRAIILASNLFDRSWYVLQYPEVLEMGLNPVDHFLAIGSPAGYAPSPDFDPRDYLKQHMDVALSGINPLLHYLKYGKEEGRSIRSISSEPDGKVRFENTVGSGTRLSECINEQTIRGQRTDTIPADEFPRTFAFYLPQFHPIAENNWAHDMGFTEWNNVINGKPLFRGHYQPKIPGELGYYDLRALDVMREQIRLATDHGISGFCFYYYYFKGKKLLYKPIENYINSDIKAPFFFLWANENWSKRWDGGDKELIIAQQHSLEDDLFFIRELAPIFRDERYIKVNGKPLLLIYKQQLFSDIRNTIEVWRNEIVKLGFPDLYLVMVDDWSSDPPHPRELGFDASYEIPSNIVPLQVLDTESDDLDLQKNFEGRIVDYRKFAKFHMSRPFPEYKRFRTVMLPWDNTARYASQAMVHINTDNDAYQLWLTQALLDTYKRYPKEERFVFIHSWNEWCEGTYMEPDGRYGRRYLEETAEAITNVRAIIESDRNGGNDSAIMLLQRIMQKKDEGAFRVMQAANIQSAHIYRELLNARTELATLRQSLSETPVRRILRLARRIVRRLNR